MEQLSVGGRQSFTPKRCSFRSSSSSDRHGFDFRCTHLTYFYGLATKAHASLEEFDFDRLPRRSAAFCDTLAGISHTQATPEYLGNFLKAVLSLANDRYAAARAQSQRAEIMGECHALRMQSSSSAASPRISVCHTYGTSRKRLLL